MRSRSDDELYSVQGRYLGPPGRTFLWQARYISYVVWAGYGFGLLILRQQLGILPGFTGYVLVALTAVLATILTMRLVSPERPPLAVLGMFAAELRAPRAIAALSVSISDPARVTVHLQRPAPRTKRR